MCGIAGWIQAGGVSSERAKDIAASMAQSLHHRGPDDEGIWYDNRWGVVFVHRRLSILDLSHAGHQPMLSSCGRYVIVFNGEIYNHQQLRSELEKSAHVSQWRGHSDTETLLMAFARWGVEPTLRRTIGMFALALWDTQTQRLVLARDRIGEKPLYYGFQNGVFLFGSELKALRQHPCFEGHIDRDALALYFKYQYIPAPYTIYAGIQKLLPGHYVVIGTHDNGKVVQVDTPPTPYWSLEEVVKRGKQQPFQASEKELVLHLEGILSQAVRGQMVADVPVGAFLSGGIDSSTIVALMQSQSTRPVRTFTIGFYEKAYNEAPYALAVAKHLGTEHTELYVTADDAIQVITDLPNVYDEPFADSSAIPTVLVSRLARRKVIVSLSGDGGDELFGGYPRYYFTTQVWSRLKNLPPMLRQTLKSIIRNIPPSVFYHITRHYKVWATSNPLARKERLLHLLSLKSLLEVYDDRCSHWKRADALVIGSADCETAHQQVPPHLLAGDLFEQMMYIDMLTYLPDDILVKVDRAAMSVSLETRVPLLDHRVVEFVWSLPVDMKIRAGQSKWLLRQLLYRYVPSEMFDRPKSGFGIPIHDWLRTRLRDWAEDLLAENRLIREGYLRIAPIRQRWQEHVEGTANWGYYLWSVLMFETWLQTYHPH